MARGPLPPSPWPLLSAIRTGWIAGAAASLFGAPLELLLKHLGATRILHSM